jgi:hypothetical protein
MKKYFLISLLFIALINSGAGCGSNSDQVIAPLAPNYLGLWGTNFEACTPTTGFSILDIEETLEITEDKIIYSQPELTPKNCQGFRNSDFGLKAEYAYVIEKDIIKITKIGIAQKVVNGVLTNVGGADNGVGFSKYLAEQLFNKDLTSKFICDGKTLKFDTFITPSYVKRK